MRLTRRLVLIAALSGLAVGLDSRADQSGGRSATAPCSGAPGEPAAFVRVSPLQVSADADGASAGQVPVQFGRAYPVKEEGPTQVRLCIVGQVYWVKRSHIALTASPRWAVLQYSELTERPRVSFWRSQERLGSHLSVGAASAAPADYHELITALAKAAYRFPVIGADFMQRALDSKQVQAVGLLVPFPMRALDEYRFIRGRHEVSLVLIVDVSGSTAGFHGPWFQQFHQIRSAAAPTAGPVMLFELGGDDSVNGPILLTTRQLAERRWNLRPARNGAPRSPSIHAALAAARQRVQGLAAKLPVLVVAGGDLDANDGAWDAFGPKWMVQLTPEIQDSLRDSRIPGLVKFLPFGPRSAADLAGQLRIPAPPPETAAAAEPDYQTFATIAADARMMAVVPSNPRETVDLAQPPAFAAEGADWFAVPLWVVLNDDSLRLTDAPE